MINTVLDRFSQYWDTFCNAPIEFQVVGGTLALGAVYMVLEASKKLWKLTLPVRWISAKTLDGTSRVLYKPVPKEKNPESKNAADNPNYFKYYDSEKKKY